MLNFSEIFNFGILVSKWRLNVLVGFCMCIQTRNFIWKILSGLHFLVRISYGLKNIFHLGYTFLRRSFNWETHTEGLWVVHSYFWEVMTAFSCSPGSSSHLCSKRVLTRSLQVMNHTQGEHQDFPGLVQSRQKQERSRPVMSIPLAVCWFGLGQS